jgi:hypothetical protein
MEDIVKENNVLVPNACRRCGSNLIRIESENTLVEEEYYYRREYGVSCMICGNEGGYYSDTIEGAIEEWNWFNPLCGPVQEAEELIMSGKLEDSIHQLLKLLIEEIECYQGDIRELNEKLNKARHG